jgi:hypothetical protein
MLEALTTEQENQVTEFTKNKENVYNLLNQTEKDVTQLEDYEKYEQRQLFLNESAREKMRLQNEILWVVFATIAAAAILAFVHYQFEWIFPDGIYTFLEAIILLLGALLTYYRYKEYLRRDPSNFYELQLPPPTTLTGADQEARKLAAVRAGQLSEVASMSTCLGEQCCASGTTFDKQSGKCKSSSTT